MSDLGDVVDAVRERVAPGECERERLEAAAETVVARTEAAVADLPVAADVLRVGSTARDTWLAGDRDIDVFVRLPADLDREDLEAYGLRVGRAVLPEGHEEYAEHPYVTGEHEGFDVDLVPCYDVQTAADIRSSVDRTPFHTAHVREQLDPDLAGDVRAFKRLLKGIGAYGSDLQTRGFSGFLAELLVLEYGGAVALIEAAAGWEPPVRFDPADHGTAEFDDPLVVIDPTDPERNVAAVCTAENVARLQHHARDLLAEPRVEPFFDEGSAPLSADAVGAHVRRRETTPIAVVFDAPDLVDDQLYPQLRRSLSGVEGALERRGFRVVRAATFADGRAVLLLDLAVADLPAVERHEGPPVHARGHAADFHDAYADADVYGPFIDGDRYVVERDREFTDAAAFLRSDAVLDVALGAHVEGALEDGYELLVGEDIARLAGEFGDPLARFYDPRP